MSILKKKATDLTVGETLGLSLGAMLLSCIPFVIAAIVEGDCLNSRKEKKEEDLPEEIMAIDEEEETSDE